MGTISNLCGLLCLIALFGHWRPHRHLLTKQHRINLQITNQQNTKKTKHLLSIAQSQVGVREATGNNDGSEVEQYLAYTGNRKGQAWCASFVSWVFGQAGFKEPRTAWSPALFPKERIIKIAEPAAIFGIYFTDKARIAHVGIIEKQKDNWLYTIEGNTNVLGSREGDGVYRKMRHIKTIKYYANWIKKEGAQK